METFMAMMVMMMLGGCGIGAVWMLSKRNGGNNPVGIAVREFMDGFNSGMSSSGNARTTTPVQRVEVTPVQSFQATRTINGIPPGNLQRPSKAMALVLLFLAGLYFLSPLDFIPDLIPGFCHVDDIGVIVLAIRNALKAFA